MKRLAIAVLLVVLIAGCGGGGGGDSSPAPPPVVPTLVGTYTLTGFDVKYSNGVFVDETNPIVKSYGGTMSISSSNYISQTISLNGTSENVSGYATIVWDSATTGKIYGAGSTLLATFSIAGNSLTTYSGVTKLSGSTLTYEEWDYWTRTSSAASVQTQSPERVDEETKSLGWIAEQVVP